MKLGHIDLYHNVYNNVIIVYGYIYKATESILTKLSILIHLGGQTVTRTPVTSFVYYWGQEVIE